MTGRFAFRASGVKRGRLPRLSLPPNVVASSILPVRKPLPRGLYGPYTFRAAVQPARSGVCDVMTEFGGDDDLIAKRLQCFSDEFLVGERAINLGRVKESHAALDRCPDERDHLLAVRSWPTIVIEPH